jgi:uncharacterized protein (TIGR03086 family)
MGDVGRWTETAGRFDSRVKLIEKGQMTGPTPCSEWTVEDLVNHVAATQIIFGTFLGLPEVEPKWADVHLAMTTLLASDDVLLGAVEVPTLGEMSRVQILEICINDMLIHTWDLSRAIGADETLPPDAAQACYEWLRSLPDSVIRAPNRYGPAAAVESHVDAQHRMLAFAGRTP